MRLVRTRARTDGELSLKCDEVIGGASPYEDEDQGLDDDSTAAHKEDDAWSMPLSRWWLSVCGWRGVRREGVWVLAERGHGHPEIVGDISAGWLRSGPGLLYAVPMDGVYACMWVWGVERV